MKSYLLNLECKVIRWLESLPGLRPLPPHLRTGLSGEREALFHLRRKGYIIVARRWTTGLAPGDIDLVAWQDDTLCFIEVKTRTARDNAPAESSVHEHKQRTLRRLARIYLKRRPDRDRISRRFDIVSVYLLPSGAEIEIHPAAFPFHQEAKPASRFSTFGI